MMEKRTLNQFCNMSNFDDETRKVYRRVIYSLTHDYCSFISLHNETQIPFAFYESLALLNVIDKRKLKRGYGTPSLATHQYKLKK